MAQDGQLPVAPADVRIVPGAGGLVVETTVRVRFAETDAMGVVYHTHYIVWFEVGRGAFWRALGLGADQDAGSFPVSAVEARYHAPARYGDVVTVRTWLAEVRSRSVTFAYECRLASTGARLAVGRTTHMFLDGQGHARSLPQPLRQALARVMAPGE